MKMNVHIREAVGDDAPQLRELLQQMGYAKPLKQIESSILAFRKEGHQLLVAEENGFLVGAIAFGCYELLRLVGSCCHIDTLVVHDKHQGKGIGRQLVEQTECYAKSYGAEMVELITANHRRQSGTHGFYASLGYQDHIELDYSYFTKDLKR